MIVMFVVCCGCGGTGGGKKETEKAKSVPAISVKSEEILNDYIRDIGTAEQKYKNKNVKITGEVESKGQFKNSQSFFIVTSYKFVGGKRYSVQLAYPVNRIDEVNKMKNGDFVAADGVCVGMVKQEEPTDISVQIHVGDRMTADSSQPAPQPTPATQPASNTTTTASQTASTEDSKPANKTGVITGTDVRMRAGAGTNTNIVGYFDRGEKVSVLSIQEGWYKVKRSDGGVGWVSADFCTIQ